VAASETLAALAGAFIGGVAVVSGSLFQARAASKADRRRYEHEEERRRQESAELVEETRRALARRYLFQLQDSVESLRRRIDNWASRGGRAVTSSDPEYWGVTNLYAMGRALAAERVLSLEGVYADLDGELKAFLTTHTVDGAIASVLSQQFFFYERLALGEAILQPEPAGYRLLTFWEFRRRYDDPSWRLESLLSTAARSLSDMTPSEMMAMTGALEELAAMLETATRVPRRRDRQSPQS
jgi:hypothetical protein